MSGASRSWDLIAAEAALRLVCRRMPEEPRGECYQEWAAELPAILDDGTSLRILRSVRALAFAVDQIRTIRELGLAPTYRRQAWSVFAGVIGRIISCLDSLRTHRALAHAFEFCFRLSGFACSVVMIYTHGVVRDVFGVAGGLIASLQVPGYLEDKAAQARRRARRGRTW